MATEIDAARLLVYRAAYLEDQNTRFTKEAAMAKLREYNVERYFRDVKLCEIGEGTSEVQRMVIAKQLGL